MKGKIIVEIRDKRYPILLDLNKASQGKLNLTTIIDFQSRAVIKIFIYQEQQATLIGELEVKNLPHEKAGEPIIYLLGEFDGKSELSFKVILKGRTYTQTSISIKKYTTEKKRALIFIPAAVIVGFLGIFLLLKETDFLRKTPAPAFEKPTASDPLTISKKDPRKSYESKERVKKEKTISSKKVTDREKKLSEPAEAIVREKEKIEPSRVISYKEEVKEPDVKELAEQKEKEIETAVLAEQAKEDTERYEKEYIQPQWTFEKEVVYFEPRRAVLIPEAKQELDRILISLNKIPDSNVTISGHCALFGTEQGRYILSVIRAQRVYNYLRQCGWNPEKKPRIEGLGGKQSVTEDTDMQRLNRRVEINIEQQ